MKIDRWFQGSGVCPGVMAGEQREEPFDLMSFKASDCLWTAGTRENLSMAEMQRFADVADRLFFARCTCDNGRYSPITKLIHTNNHPETTREDIDKILAVFSEESERDSA